MVVQYMVHGTVKYTNRNLANTVSTVIKSRL